MRVGVIGFGSGGPAAALLLRRAGHQVSLFERAPTLGAVGTGFLLQPTGQRVLSELGLLRETRAHGSPVQRLHSRTREGRVLIDLEYRKLASDLFGLGLHRATLLHALARAARASGVELHLGCEITHIAPARSGSGYRIETQGGAIPGRFDLVLIANGARSALRGALGVRYSARPYPWGALWSIVPDPERRFAGALYQVVDGTRTMVGFLDTGRRSDAPDAGPLVSLFWSVEGSRVDAIRRRGARALRDEIVRLVPRAEPLLESIQDMDQWAHARYLDVRMSRWHGPRIAVLGDAGHAMSPQLGQGVNLALWDAHVLARALERRADVDLALRLYSQSRRAHLRFYQRATRWLTPLFQSSIPLAGWLRDRAFPWLGRIAPLEREMVRSMAGLKLGFLRGSLPLDDP